MKTLLLATFFVSSSLFAGSIECYRDIDLTPVYTIDTEAQTVLYKDQSRDTTKCEFKEGKIICTWFKHWMNVNIQEGTGSMTLIAPPGWTWELRCESN